ncbi:conserved hypothetical protein [Pseudorhizobium banfieldiae]|uniref:Uncharacterized protein n=2 Tax=Pseudorhizobium banfieldiae TaxID=1125847 RepID=L0NB63_9HYPH|nr:conserved hypothetical protein [Pseudorhizobium banfieldiae]
MLLSLLIFPLLALAILAWQRLKQLHEDDSTWAALASKTPWHDESFDETMVAGLPVAARRFFLFAIRPGTPLRTVVEVKSTAKISIGHRPPAEVTTYQILAAPHGSLSRYYSKNSLALFSGNSLVYEGRACLRFWCWKMFPFGSSGASVTVLFERMGIDAALWAPAGLLPRNGVIWQEISDTAARATMTSGELTQSIEIMVQPTGQLEWVRGPGPDATIAVPSGFRLFDGYQLPTNVKFQNVPEAIVPLSSRTDAIRFVGPWIGASHA